MKLISVLVIALFLVAGIGSAQNYLPESTMEPGANLSYYDSGTNIQTFDFADEPADGDIFVSASDIWRIVATKYIDNEIIVGPSSDTYSYFYDYECDGTDDYATINIALNAAAPSQNNYINNKIIMMPGRYNLGDGSIDIPIGVSIIGGGRTGAYDNPNTTAFSGGAVIFNVTNQSIPAIYIHSSSTIRGITAYYSEQNTSGAPIEYEPFITNTAESEYIIDNTFADINLYNSYIGIEIDPIELTAGRNHFYNIVGHPIYRGIYYNNSTDVDVFRDIDFNINFYSNLQNWSQENGTAITLGQTVAWPTMDTIFMSAYYNGLVVESDSGSFNNIHVDFCRHCILLATTASNNVFNNIQCTAYQLTPYETASTDVAVYVNGTYNNFLGGSITLCGGEAFWIQGNKNRVCGMMLQNVGTYCVTQTIEVIGSYNIINGNHVDASHGTIRLLGNYNIATDNMCLSGQVYDAGANNVVADNIAYPA